MNPGVTRDEVEKAIGYVVREREIRRRSGSPERRYQKVFEMNKVLDVLRLAENVVSAIGED